MQLAYSLQRNRFVETSTDRTMMTKMDERRQFIEDWGPFMLSGIPMLFALYLALTYQPTRPSLVDPLFYVMAMLTFSGISFLAANVLMARSPRAVKVLFFTATVIAIPGMFIKGVTQPSAVQLAWISVAWGAVALVGKFRGFWWIQAPLERISGVAAKPEEWVQEWLEKYYEVNPFEIPAEEALQRAKLDWNAMLEGGEATSAGQAAAQSLMRTKPSLAARVKAFILDEDLDQEEISGAQSAPKMFAFIMPKTDLAGSPEPRTSAADLLRRYRFDYEEHEEVEEEAETFHREPKQRWWKRLLSDEDSADDEEPRRLLSYFSRRRHDEHSCLESEPEDDLERIRRILREARR